MGTKKILLCSGKIYYELRQLRADLKRAGWYEVQLDNVRLEGRSPSAADYAVGFVRGSPLNHELVERGADLDQVVRRLTEALVRIGGDRPLRVEQSAIVITAVR